MPDRERDAAIKRLRKAAEDVIAARTSEGRKKEAVRVHYGKKPAELRLVDAWAEFPECERDEVVPSPEEVLARCDAYDRQKEEAERIAARGSCERR